MGLELEIRNVLLCTVQVLLFAQVASFVTCGIVQDASTSCHLNQFGQGFTVIASCSWCQFCKSKMLSLVVHLDRSNSLKCHKGGWSLLSTIGCCPKPQHISTITCFCQPHQNWSYRPAGKGIQPLKKAHRKNQKRVDDFVLTSLPSAQPRNKLLYPQITSRKLKGLLECCWTGPRELWMKTTKQPTHCIALYNLTLCKL